MTDTPVLVLRDKGVPWTLTDEPRDQPARKFRSLEPKEET